MLEQIDAQIAADLDKGSRGDPAAKPPQQIVAGDKREQQSDRRPQSPLPPAPFESASTRFLTPYCEPTAQPTAASTEAITTKWLANRRRT